ncbi:MAG: hypothetical protein VXZ72_03075 [Chlamydiota bacterium]|nr:hypothetical protein [Chlamydiota bacterium]
MLLPVFSYGVPMITVRVGLPMTTGHLPIACERMEAPALISANSLWDRKNKRFRSPGAAICDLDVALDSAGFVAMTQYGGYLWSVEEYVELAGLHSWTWWAQMDYCCEPEIADSQQTIDSRIWASAYNLAYCRKVAQTWRTSGADWLQDPMPVIQGWSAKDYLRCIDLYDDVLRGNWPSLVGVGSVCRRSVSGQNGLLEIVSRLTSRLPDHVGLHLFGVKGSALPKLSNRVVSIDSAAWQYRARMIALEKNEPCTTTLKESVMNSWYQKQAMSQSQKKLF